MSGRPIRRLAGFAAVAMLVVGMAAGPASAHADLSTSDPEAGASVPRAPRALTLTFTEGVSMRDNGLRVIDANGSDLDVGTPTHPGGRSEVVRSSLPKLADGLYVVVWQATSEDSHPIRGSFTFGVGSADVSGKHADLLAQAALSEGAGDSNVGFALGVARFGVFVGLALLLGGAIFVVGLWPAGGGDRRVRATLHWALGLTFVATVAGFLLQGPYTSSGGFGDVFSSDQISAVWDTRFGKVWVLRLALLLVTGWLIRRLVRRPGAQPGWWKVVAGLTAVALAATPGLSGHGSVGRWASFALLADVLHVLAMAVWLGGLLVLVFARSDEQAYPRVAARFSAVAFSAVVVLVVTGSFQAIRQLETVSALWDSDYGRILLVKLAAFALLLGIAAWSRRLVHGRTLRVGAGDRSADGPGADDAPAGSLARLQHSVRSELVVGAVVLALTSMLVNTAPPAVVPAAVPLQTAIDAGEVTFDTFFGPARVGEANALHVSVRNPSGQPARVIEMRASIALPEQGIARIPIEMTGSGDHFIAEDVRVPFAGKWTLELHALLTEVDEASAKTIVTVG